MGEHSYFSTDLPNIHVLVHIDCQLRQFRRLLQNRTAEESEKQEFGDVDFAGEIFEKNVYRNRGDVNYFFFGFYQ